MPNQFLISELNWIRSKQLAAILFISMFVLTFFQSCRHPESARKKIVYVNSYHRGHPSSDDMMDGIMKSFSADSFEMVSYFMDTKRNTSHEFIVNRAAEIYNSIADTDPEILIVSDDNAVKYLVQPFMQDGGLPVVFCGVNMSADQYNLPRDRVTGMIEMLPLADLLHTMKPYYPAMRRLFLLSENTTTSRKEAELLDTLFNRVGISASFELVDDFDQWKTIFREANQDFDIIYIVTHAAIRGWDHKEALDFINKHIKIPVVTCEDFMMPYAVFGLTKVAREHGLWSAAAARKILGERFPQKSQLK
jgi:ABC-type uncharacterized transport system substrate-binding protein